MLSTLLSSSNLQGNANPLEVIVPVNAWRAAILFCSSKEARASVQEKSDALSTDNMRPIKLVHLHALFQMTKFPWLQALRFNQMCHCSPRLLFLADILLLLQMFSFTGRVHHQHHGSQNSELYQSNDCQIMRPFESRALNSLV